MLLIIGEEDNIIYQYGQPESPQTLFEIYASLDQLETFRLQTDKTFLEYATDLTIKNQNIFIFLVSDKIAFYLVVPDSLQQNLKKLKKTFKLIHYEFAKAILDPLYELNSYISNQKFATQVEKIIQTNLIQN